MLLIGIRLCRCSVGLRGHVTDGKTYSYYRSFLIGEFAISVNNENGKRNSTATLGATIL